MNVFVVEQRLWQKHSCPECKYEGFILECDVAFIASTFEKAQEFIRQNAEYDWRNHPWYWVICSEVLDAELVAGTGLVAVYDWDGNNLNGDQPAPDAEMFKGCDQWKPKPHRL